MSGRKNALNALEKGSGGVPLFLIHGFAGTLNYWDPIMERMPATRQIIALDLPGHGRSPLGSGSARTVDLANALLEEIKRRKLEKIHLCGHSMGGAIAALVALKQPALAGSLTLLAPGGFGSEINARLLRRYARADSEILLRPLFEQFYGSIARPSEKSLEILLNDRKRPEACDIFEMIADNFLKGEEQGELPREAIAGLGISVKVIWGTQDRILPTRQAHKLPGEIAIHVFEDVGHNIVDEIPDAVTRLISENIR
jgi:pimeloyl-ACP methyl ester carboxylesterase